ncbi:hypothetical protein HPB52_014463 [Rhipicephalus sanguineus]|uniref:Tick transposon n=1 Tax=Rhipicephalus sanguineus TaxID=34632 RepID=A0A9D4SNH9_RHISA|nr:hypothetical protein HPB52_014463 [Rhipicephalus sanguineus]
MSVHHHHATGALPATRKTPKLNPRGSCAALSVELVTPQGTRSAQNATSPHDYFYKGAESRLNDVLFNMPQHLRNSNTKKILNLHLGAFPEADLGTVRGADQEAKPEGPHNLGATVTRRPPGSPPKPVIHWSVNRDTTPDVTMVKRASFTEWHNTGQTFGSDHCVLQTLIAAGPRKWVGRTLSITDCDAFRACRAARTSPEGCAPDLETWTSDLVADAEAATKWVLEDAGAQQLDSKLLHMLEALAGLRKRYKTQKLNRTLRKRIGILNTVIEKYALQLTNQQWHAACNGMQRQPNISKTWSILQHLLNARTSKTTQQRIIQKLLHQTQAADKQFLSNHVDKYLGDQATQPQMPYTGQDNASLDAPITLAEVQATVRNLRPNSAPGDDRITNLILQNADDDSLATLLQHINIVWDQESTHPIMLEVKGHPIPCGPSLRVLGLRIQQNRKNTDTTECLKTHATQIGRLIARIANKHMGMKEDNLLRLVQAFIISRIVYVAPFLCLSDAEKHKINIIIKKTYKQALHVPQSTENQKLMELGLHNTIEE